MFKTNKVISLGLGLILLTTLVLIGAGCKQNEDIDKLLDTDEFLAKYCPKVMIHKPDLYNSVDECIVVQKAWEDGFWKDCMSRTNNEEECLEKRYDWRKTFLKNLAGVEK